MKFGLKRIDDSVTYLWHQGHQSIATRISQLLVGQSLYARVKLNSELTLGSRMKDVDDVQYANDTQQRHALRALLLCQRIFLSTLWYPQDRLPAGWKDTSFAYWKDKPENQVREAIDVYQARSDVAAAAVTVAKANRYNNHALSNLFFTKTSDDFPIHKTCYMAVMCWLFKSGLVSYPWLLRHWNSSDEATLRAAFGAGHVIWGPDDEFDANATLPIVLPGHIVHMYTPPYFRGHWLISNGDGTACGCNNDSEGGAVDPTYSTACSLDAQFRLGFAYQYRDPATDKPRDDPKKLPSFAVVIDPLQIPGRD